MNSNSEQNHAGAPWKDAGPHWEELQSGVSEDTDLRRLQQPAGWSELRRLRWEGLYLFAAFFACCLATMLLSPLLGWFWFVGLVPAAALLLLLNMSYASLRKWKCPVCRDYFFEDDSRLFQTALTNAKFTQRKCVNCNADSRAVGD